MTIKTEKLVLEHDDVIKWKHFPRNWPLVRGIHRSPVNSPHKGQWRGALMFSLICAWIKGWVNDGEVGDLRLYRAHYDVIVMNNILLMSIWLFNTCVDGYYNKQFYSAAHNATSYIIAEFQWCQSHSSRLGPICVSFWKKDQKSCAAVNKRNWKAHKQALRQI